MKFKKQALREGSKAEEAMDRRQGARENGATDKRLDRAAGVKPAKGKGKGK